MKTTGPRHSILSTEPPAHHEEGDELRCPGCGLPTTQWSHKPHLTATHLSTDAVGYINRAGELFCCPDCASGKGCECVPKESAKKTG